MRVSGFVLLEFRRTKSGYFSGFARCNQGHRSAVDGPTGLAPALLDAGEVAGGALAESQERERIAARAGASPDALAGAAAAAIGGLEREGQKGVTVRTYLIPLGRRILRVMHEYDFPIGCVYLLRNHIDNLRAEERQGAPI